MEVNKEEIKFTILPHVDEVKAEIFKIQSTNYGDINIHLISKSFGGIFRKPIEKDYINARKWVEMQMKSIEKANTLDNGIQ